MAKLRLDLDITPDVKTGKVASGVATIEKLFEGIEELELIDADALEAELRQAASGVEGFEDALKDVADAVGDIDASLKKLRPDEINELGDAFDTTKKRLDDLLKKQQSAAAQMIVAGQKGSAEWEQLQAEIAETTKQAKIFEDALKEVQQVQSEGSILEKMFALEGIAKAGDFLNGITEKTAESRREMERLAIASDATGEELGELKESADDVFRAVGGSIAEARSALTASTTALGDILPKDQLEDAAIFGAQFKKQWDKDVNETLGKGAPFIENFGLQGKEAFDLIAFGQRETMTGDDDFLDTIKEYSVQFKEAGFSAGEFVGVLDRGVGAGAFNTDAIGDSIKEATIRITSAGNDVKVALDEITGAPEALKTKLNAALEDVRSGKITIKEFFQVTAKDIQGAVDSGMITDTVKKQLEVGIGGAPLENLGAGMYTTLFAAPIDTASIGAKAAEAGTALRDGFGTLNVFESVGREVEIFTTETAELFAPFISGAGSALGVIGQIGPGLTLLQDKFKIFDVAGDLIKGLVPRIAATIPALFGQAAATGTATGAQIGLNLAMLANPAFLLVAGIGAVVAAFIIFGDETKDVKTAIEDLNAATEDYNATVAAAQETKKTTDSLKALADEYDRLAEKKDPESLKRLAEVTAELEASVPDAAEAVDVLGDKGEVTGSKFVIATDAVREFATEKQKLADQDAAEQLAVLTDEAAALVDSYGESTENLKKLRAEQEDLKEETTGETVAKAYSGELITRAIGLTNTQKEAQAEVRKEIAAESKERETARKKIAEAIALLGKAGKSQQEIKEQLGLSDQQAKEFAGALREATKSTQGTTTAATGLQAATQRAKLTAQDLAAAWDKVKGAADAAYNNTFKAVLALKDEQRQATRELANLGKQDLTILADAERQKIEQRKIFLQQRLKDLPKEIADEVNAAKQALKDKRGLELEETKLKLQVGEIDFSVTDFTQQARDVRREIGDIFFDIANGNEADLLKQALEKIDADLGSDVQKLKDQITGVRKQVQQLQNDGNPATIAKGADDLISALNKKIKALEDKAKDDRIKAEQEVRKKMLEEFAKFLAEENRLLTVGLNAQVDELNRQADAITGIDDDSLTERLSKRQQALSIQQALELKALVESNEDYLAKYGDLQFALRDIENATTDETRQAATERAAQLRQDLGKLQQQIITTNAAALAIQLKYQNEVTQVEADILEIRYQRQDKALQDALARQLGILTRASEERQQLVEEIAGFAADIGTAALDIELAKQIDRIDQQIEAFKNREGEILASAEALEAEKLRLQEEAEAKREALQARADAIRIEAARQTALQELEIQRKSLEDRLKLAEESGRVDEANEIGAQLDAVGEQIKDKGSVLTGLATGLQGNITDLVTNLFQGDPDAVKAPFRSAFQSLAGALQQLATAKVTEVVLGSISGLTGIPGLIASFAAKPVIAALINSILSPVFDSLLSFNTGGRVDAPTLALLGDIPSGARNREWVFRDDQLRQIMLEAAAVGQGSLIGEMRATRSAMESMASREWRLRGGDIVGAATRTRRSQSRRVINPSRLIGVS